MNAPWRIILCFVLALLPQPGFARDAAFVEPGTFAGKGASADALIADPKSFEAGESTVGIMRRVSLFFVNAGSAPLTLVERTATGDGNVKVEIENSDCAAQSKIATASRCTVSLAITPTSAGAWSVEILVRHDGIGRIARALVTGRAINDAKSATRAEGLNLSSRDMKPIDFGEVDLAGAPAVRTALMVNDSPETITIQAIDLIMVDHGLERLTTGCEVDEELKPDASCPITLKWQPKERGNIATDLIMRHTGKIGFTVIPVRGKGIGEGGSGMTQTTALPHNNADNHGQKTLPVPPTPSDDAVENITGQLPPAVTGDPGVRPVTKVRGTSGDKLYFIGLVGTRAIFQYSGVTKSAQVGDDVEFGNMTVKLLALAERKARVLVNGQQRIVQLGASDYRPASSSSSKNGKDDGSKLPVPSSISQSSSGK